MKRTLVIGGAGTVGRQVISQLIATVADITRTPARTFRDWVIDHAAEFQSDRLKRW